MAELKQFSESEIILNQEEAWKVLRFFWADLNVNPSALGPREIAFAQGLLLEAIDASYNEGYIEILFRVFYGKVPARSFGELKKLVTSFAKKALKHWFKHATGKHLESPKIYENVRVTIARNFRTPKKELEMGILTY
ncbi:MAG: hypothetical protein EHM61_19750 [Acidobacteria bacterium]|nr:MAG: hypothetical protein EHM61_19750 [Acidobacteriota bacterium]